MAGSKVKDQLLSTAMDAVRRGERLARSYLMAELVLREQDIQQTIVVFGSTRITELTQSPPDGQPDYYRVAREFGALVGRSGRGPADCRLTLVTGGGPGIMEAANRGASEVGAKSIGLTIKLPREQLPNKYVSEELRFNFRYFAIRKLHFLIRAKALVVFPGGFGTLDELFETLNLVETGVIAPLPIVLIGEEFWRRAFDLEFLAGRGVIGAGGLKLFWYSETAAEAWNSIIQWHRHAGTPLLCDLEAPAK
ncbi:MAG: LOG family protein [Gammaproteobacteria bacterium]|nr:LOG family protein [Gammaproteobacteria bacterium]